MSFQLPQNIDKNKVFLVNSSDLEGRLDPFCYIPELVKLDKKIKSKTKYRLKDFSTFRASGATPSKSNDEYYSDRQNGIPFVRVQNLSVTGELDQSNLVYISKDIHEGLLKRSQIKEYDLLVKITGVGRMAVASVVPDGFNGNINQHIVVIRTGSKETSENVAAFLNLDSVEKIATKRATGGTRPALDYPALFSIPVVNNRNIYIKIHKAVSSKNQKEAEAQRLLDSIDEFLMSELGVKLPEKNNSLANRVFITRLKNLTNRLEPFYYQEYFKKLEECLNNGKYQTKKLSCICDLLNGYAFKSSDYIEYSSTINIRMSNIRPDNDFDPDYKIKYLPDSFSNTYKQYIVKDGDLIIAMTDMAADPKILGVPTIVSKCRSRKFLLNQRVGKIFNINFKIINIDYLYNILGSVLIKEYFNQQGARGVQINISREQILSAKIPLPPLDVQVKIASHIKKIRNQAKQLLQEAQTEVEQAKKEVETMILGEA